MQKFIRKHLGATLVIVITSVIIPAIMIHYNLFASKPLLKFYLGDSYHIARTDKIIDSLSIVYKGKDISKDSMNLKVTTIKIRNKGFVNIKMDDYSQHLGLKIRNCKIIDAEVDKSKNDSLSKELNPQVINDSTILMNNLPFDCHEDVSFNVFLLYKWNEIPDYYAIGKLIGAKEIPEPLIEGEDDPLITWADVLDIIIIISFESVLLAIIYFCTTLYRKARFLNKLNPHKIIIINPTQELFVKLYKKLGKKSFLSLMIGIVKGDDYLRNEEQFLDAFKKVNETRKGFFFFIRKVEYVSPFSRCINILTKKGLLTEQSGKFIISQELKDEAQATLNLFISPHHNQ